MAEPARKPSSVRPAPAPAFRGRSLPRLYANYLPDLPMTQTQSRGFAWICRELSRLALVAAVVLAFAVFVWSRQG